MSKEELLKKLSESDNVEIMEDIQDSWIEIPEIKEEDFNNLKTENEILKKDYDDLRQRYKERFFENTEPKKMETNEGLHEEKIFKVENIFKEV